MHILAEDAEVCRRKVSYSVIRSGMGANCSDDENKWGLLGYHADVLTSRCEEKVSLAYCIILGTKIRYSLVASTLRR